MWVFFFFLSYKAVMFYLLKVSYICVYICAYIYIHTHTCLSIYILVYTSVYRVSEWTRTSFIVNWMLFLVIQWILMHIYCFKLLLIWILNLFQIFMLKQTEFVDWINWNNLSIKWFLGISKLFFPGNLISLLGDYQ